MSLVLYPEMAEYARLPPFHIIETPLGKCHTSVSSDATVVEQSDIVVFFGPLNPHMPNFPRPPGALWLYFTTESNIANVAASVPFSCEINALMSYDRAADFRFPYGYFEKRTTPFATNETYDFVKKDRMAVNIRTNCDAYRQRHIESLRAYGVTVDVMSHHGCSSVPFIPECVSVGLTDPGQVTCLKVLGQTYKFYFAMENSDCVDYITEKTWLSSLENYMVPVVWGTRNDYLHWLPPNSFINCADFASTQLCADHILRVASDPDLYASYHEWRTTYQAHVAFRNLRSNHTYDKVCEFALRNNNVEKKSIDIHRLRDPMLQCSMNDKFD